jgi:C4-dicarboxylate-specific signal transduction histidine kinase
LAAISLHSEVLAKELEKKGALDAVTANRIRVVRQMTERIAKIVKGFLAISRDGAADPQLKFHLSEIIQETLVISQSRLNTNGVRLQVAPVPEVILKCRAVQISQVLLNLLNNAHDAVQKLEEKWIRIDFVETNSQLSILVTDSGSGIPKSLVEKIMEPFFTTKDINKGTGLGLSISKSIIEAHGGRFYYNAVCDNTQFVIELPIA